MPTRTPTLSELLDKWRDGILRDVRVAFPAVVQSYDAAKQTALLKPLIGDSFLDDDDSPTNIPMPILVDVPVIFPGGGGFRATFPVAAGDVVQVLVSDRSLDAWLDQGGEQFPADGRRHHLSDAVCVPGLHDAKHPWTGARTDGATWGQDGGPQVAVTAAQIELGGTDDNVACASKVAAQLTALWNALNAHVHVVAALGTSAPPTGTPLGSAGSVASSIVKVKQ